MLPLIVGGVLILLGFQGITSSVKGLRRDRLILDTPTSKARSIAMGKVELYGMAVPYEKKRTRTPFGGKDCIWCKWTVEVENIDHNHKTRYKKITEGEMPGFFWLQDDTGRVLVYTKGAEAEAKYTQQYNGAPSNEARIFLNNQGIGPDAMRQQPVTDAPEILETAFNITSKIEPGYLARAFLKKMS
jgi:hypothetical protein